MKANKVYQTLKSYVKNFFAKLFGRKQKKEFMSHVTETVKGSGMRSFRRVKAYYDGNSQNGYAFKKAPCQRKKKSNRITMKKRLHLKHRKAA